MRPTLPLALLAVLLAGCSHQTQPAADAALPPPPPREFRAAWVATVANIDWPSRKGLTEKQQKRELLDILDRAHRIGFNTIVQCRF